MTEQEYKKLNDYLNIIFLELSKNDVFFINNIKEISMINDKFLDSLKHYEIKDEHIENNLTYNDVYVLAREIIESIDKKYLNKFDNLIQTGQLNFDYENKIDASIFQHVIKGNQSFNIIDLKRTFTYLDVVMLVHEYFHYTNGLEDITTMNRYLLTEFISIYFEMYALDFLVNKGVSKEELEYNDRIIDTIKHSKQLEIYDIVFLAYEKFGNINENTVNDLNNYICSISKEQFEKKCNIVLYNLKKIEKKYKKDILYEEDYDTNKLSHLLSTTPSINYRYILGTLLAIYTKKYSSIDKMIILNDTINNNTCNELLLLKSIGIDLNKDTFYDELFECLEEYLNRFNSKKVI